MALPNFSDLNVLIIGDAMVDFYLFGEVNRISPEAPVPVVEISHKESRPGGAANVALNISRLGANPILLSMIGRDVTGALLLRMLKEEGIKTTHVLQNKNRITTLKTRIFDEDKQVVRFDEEDITDLNEAQETLMVKEFRKILANEQIDVIIIQDYNKGLLTKYLIKQILLYATKYEIPVVVDPKSKNFFEYQAVDLFKPNLREFCDSIGYRIHPKSLEGLRSGAEELRRKNRFKNLMVTLGPHGIFCFTRDGSSFIVPAKTIKAADVSGAGDTVVSIAALAYRKKYSLKEVAQLCNRGAAAVCKKIGVTPVTLRDLK
ncbi:MAG: bifunctional ADP-heptose synthase [Chitinophagales bacterium]|nr:bifunctional ADP-heptose synthase [Chitinophagales bacterium]MDW8419789.1 bifunctional ADP-heptose synthase [Chitinophagales bacterium]